MTTIHVATTVNCDGSVGSIDEFKGNHVSFMTEPSGVLVVFRRPADVWQAYAPGHWKVVRDVLED
jgi:hypothetical protein